MLKRLSIASTNVPVKAAWRASVRFILSRGHRFKKSRPVAQRIIDKLNEIDKLRTLRSRKKPGLRRAFREILKCLERQNRYAETVYGICSFIVVPLLLWLMVAIPRASFGALVGDSSPSYSTLDFNTASGFAIVGLWSLFVAYFAVVEIGKLVYRLVASKPIPASLPILTHFTLPIFLSYLIQIIPPELFLRILDRFHRFSDLPNELKAASVDAFRVSSSDFLLAFASLWYLSNWISGIVVKRRAALHPAAIIAARLIDVVCTLERKVTWAADVELKQALLRDIEHCARTIERFLPPRLKSGDITTDRWTKESARQIANAIRARKKSIVAPSKDTTRQLLPFFTNALLCVTTGNWDGLERVQAETLGGIIKTRLLGSLRIGLQALLPFIALWVFQKTPLAFSLQVTEWIKGFVLLWAVYILGSAIDPRHKQRLEEFTSLFPIRLGKGKE